jgi:acyl phosphate:glycerol-3-phosphate acyltransferase
MGPAVTAWVYPILALLAGYLIGSIPFAYIIVKLVSGEDVTEHGTGNIGSMNVRRTTGSWGWFVVAMLCDGFKGMIPVAVAKVLAGFPFLPPYGVSLGSASMLTALVPPAVVLGAVLGHNYSVWMALIHKRFSRTGKGLATGAGTLLAYDWRYFIAVIVVALLVIALTRYMMAGQVAAAFTLPATALILRSPDWPFAVFMGLLVYAAHHKRFVGMLQGREPKLYVDDRMGPRG